ncbi:MAG: arsenic transporter [Ectobacillus sp.]
MIFVGTMLVIFWRPRGLNEAIPASVGAILLIIIGTVSKADMIDISSKVTGAAITIISTIVMAMILESFGFFHWCAARLAKAAKGSGIRLFWYTNLLCFLMTVFFNNDGSILITTPVLLLLLNRLQLKNHQKIPYLLSGALIATASSAPIGVSNIVNLIALEIVDMTLYMHTAMIFVPATLGLLFMSFMLFLVLRKHIPKKLPEASQYIYENFINHSFHPLQTRTPEEEIKKQNRFMLKILLFVFLVRCSLFIASFLNVSVEAVAVAGSLILLVWRWYKLKIHPGDMLRRTPWYVLIFAFAMYVIVYGLHNIGLTDYIVFTLKPHIHDNLLNASLLMGGALSVMSNFFNNHPALMIGTIALTEMGLDPTTVKTIYLANIIGSDMGSLLLPIGTLASLMWMHIVKKGRVRIGWKQYVKVTFIVIPPTVVFTLICLYLWIKLIFVHS